MDILPSQNKELLSVEQQAIQKILPDVLSIKNIIELWTSDKKRQESIRKAMLEDYKKDVLVSEYIDESSRNENLKIHRDNFETWLSQLHKKPITECFHDNCLLANWWANEIVEPIKAKTLLNSINENNSFSFYEAYRELESRLTNLSYTEFGLFVFDSDIRIFEKRPDDKGNLKQLFGSWELNEVGVADSFSNDATPLNLTLTRFRYAKDDIERLTPNYRYICFDDACKEIAYFANKPEEEIKEFLIQKAEVEKIYPYHPYCGFVHPEQEKFLPSSAFPDYQIAQVLRDDFGISEYGYAFDIEVYLAELKEKGNSDDEINRIRKISDRRLESNAILIEKHNAIAEIASLRHGVDEYHKDADRILNTPIPVMPDSPQHKDMVMRYVWLHELEVENERVYKTPWCPERDEKIKQINEKMDEINRQLYGDVDGHIHNSHEQHIAHVVECQNNSKDGKKKTNFINKFASFQNLRANQISLVMMERGEAKVVINKKRINVFPNDFGLKEKSQGWKLLEGAATANGDLQSALRGLNKSSNRENETRKIRTAINRLNKKLKESLGLQENPIILDAGNYRFTFKEMTHELIYGLNVTKGADAMDYLSDKEPDEVNSTQDFWADRD